MARLIDADFMEQVDSICSKCDHLSECGGNPADCTCEEKLEWKQVLGLLKVFSRRENEDALD